MNVFGQICAYFCLAAAVFLFVCLKREERVEIRSLKRFKASNFYVSFLRQMQEIANLPIDQIVIERSGVYVTCLYPAKTLLALCPLEDAREVPFSFPRLLALALQMDCPWLADRDLYALHRYRIVLSGGEVEYGYSLSMTRYYKRQVFRQAERGVRVISDF